MYGEIDNNQVNITGKIASRFVHSHDTYGEGFYLADVEVERLSGTYDSIPVMVSEHFVNVEEDSIDKYIEVSGQFRSYNRHGDAGNRLVLSVFAREAVILSGDDGQKPNSIFLDGYVCRQPIYRKTPLGREIADVLLAVNRPYGKSDYIPCICWGRNARFADSFQAGSNIQVWGRIQSREYQKKIGEEDFETRTAYEVSVNRLERID